MIQSNGTLSPQHQRGSLSKLISSMIEFHHESMPDIDLVRNSRGARSARLLNALRHFSASALMEVGLGLEVVGTAHSPSMPDIDLVRRRRRARSVARARSHFGPLQRVRSGGMTRRHCIAHSTHTHWHSPPRRRSLLFLPGPEVRATLTF
jgi:hypothetical protein